MQRDVVLIPAKGLATGKSRLRHVLSRAQRQALNISQLHQTLCAAIGAYGPDCVHVVSPCLRVAGIASSVGVMFLPERAPAGLNSALEQARRHILASIPRCISVLPVDLPCVSAAVLRALLQTCTPEEPIIVPDRARKGTNFMRLPIECGIPFGYGEGSFSRHVQAISRAGFAPRVVEHTCLRDDLDEPAQLSWRALAPARVSGM